MALENIINRIIGDAEKKAQSFIDSQQEKADEITIEADKKIEAYRNKGEDKASNTAKSMNDVADVIVELEISKIELHKKRELIDKIFELALEKILKLPKAEYKKIILKNLDDLRDGDVIILSEKEKGILLKKDIDEIAKKKGIKVSLSSECNSNVAGIIIDRKSTVLDFNIETELENLKKEMESEILKGLYK
jgi:ATP synthase, subunit E